MTSCRANCFSIRVPSASTPLAGPIPGIPWNEVLDQSPEAQGYFTDIEIDRQAIARYGLTVEDVQDVIQSAIGGENVTRTIEGRERYPVNVRYNRDFREDIPGLERVLVRTPMGAQVPLGHDVAVMCTGYAAADRPAVR